MIRSGEFTRQFVEGIDDSQVQPNGVDISIDKIYKLRGPCVLTDDEYFKNEREEVKVYPEGTYINKDPSYHQEFIQISGYPPADNVLNEVEKGYGYWKELEHDSYVMRRNPYIVVYEETLEVPEGHVGFMMPRSRLLRCGNHLTTAVWDSGYKGRGEGALLINTATAIQTDMKIAQFVLFESEDSDINYEGSHQGERLDG